MSEEQQDAQALKDAFHLKGAQIQILKSKQNETEPQQQNYPFLKDNMPMSSPRPPELPICPDWCPKSDSCPLISTIMSSKVGEEMFIFM